MTLASRIGIPLSEWRQMTPREVKLWASTYVKRSEQEERTVKTRIYNLAGLIRTMIWAKHPPRYESVFPERKTAEPMDDDAMYAQVRALNALFGGKEG